MSNSPRDNRDILDMFQDNLTRSEDKFGTVNTRWQEDNDFSLGIQWDEGTRNDRSVPGSERPIITINKIDPLVHRIVNEAKQEKIEAIVKAGNDTTDPDAAEILTGYLRKIQYDSNAARVYMWAYECAVRAGIGAFKVINKFEEDSFDQTICFERIKDPTTVNWDPDAQDPCGRDQNFCIISAGISKVMAERACKAVDFDPKEIVGAKETLWRLSDGEIRDSEMQWVEYSPDELIELADGSIVRKSQITAEAYDLVKNTPNLIKQIRKIQSKQVKYAHLCDSVVIEKLDINSNYITIVRMIGREGYIAGELDYRGITRNSMDPNRMYNVMSSLLVERVGLAPRAPYIGAAGQFEGYQEQWLRSNKVNLPALEYNPVSLNGTLVPPPMKNDAPAGDPSIERYLMIADTDIKDTSSVSDAFMGNRSNETTGVAIKARAGQSGLATYDLLDNCHDAIQFGAAIALNMAPKIISQRRVIQILGEDMTEKVVNLEAFVVNGAPPKKIDFFKGKFTCEIAVSSGDKTRREKAIEQLSFVLQTNPEAANLIMDIFVANLDIKDSKKISNRFKALLPPNIIAAEENTEKDNPELDAFEAHATQIIQQLKGQFDQCKAALDQATKELEDKKAELNIKQQEVDVKKQEANTKELQAMASQIEAKSKAKEEGKTDTKAEDELEDLKVEYLVKHIQQLQEEVDLVHKQMEQVTQILIQDKAKDSQENASEGPAPSPEVTDTGNGLPPTDAVNVGPNQ